MLAQNFRTPTDLYLTDAEFESLVNVLEMLERGEIKPEQFDMSEWCGAACCLRGHAIKINNSVFSIGELRPVDSALFIPIIQNRNYHSIQPHEAAIALRSYLSTGEPNWAEALAD